MLKSVTPLMKINGEGTLHCFGFQENPGAFWHLVIFVTYFISASGYPLECLSSENGENVCHLPPQESNSDAASLCFCPGPSFYF